MDKQILIDHSVRLLKLGHYEDQAEKIKDQRLEIELNIVVRQFLDEVEKIFNERLNNV